VKWNSELVSSISSPTMRCTAWRSSHGACTMLSGPSMGSEASVSLCQYLRGERMSVQCVYVQHRGQLVTHPVSCCASSSQACCEIGLRSFESKELGLNSSCLGNCLGVRFTTRKLRLTRSNRSTAEALQSAEQVARHISLSLGCSVTTAATIWTQQEVLSAWGTRELGSHTHRNGQQQAEAAQNQRCSKPAHAHSRHWRSHGKCRAGRARRRGRGSACQLLQCRALLSCGL
jgi:hypothetical protein